MTLAGSLAALDRTRAAALVAGLATVLLVAVTVRQVRVRQELRQDIRVTEQQLEEAAAETEARLAELDAEIARVRQELEARGISAPPPQSGAPFPPGSELTWILELTRQRGLFLQTVAHVETQPRQDPPGTTLVILRLGAAGTTAELMDYVGAIPSTAPTARLPSVLLEGAAEEASLQLEVRLTSLEQPVSGPLPDALTGLPPTFQGAVVRLQVQLDRAWSAERWPEVLEILSQLSLIAPGYPQLQEKFYAAHFNHGVRLEEAGQLDAAIEQYTLALARLPSGQEAQVRLQRLTSGGLAQTGAAPALDPTAFEFFYIVQPGDTLFFIAASFGVTEEAVLSRNRITGVRPGQRLVIRPPADTEVTLVGEEETLAEIAERTGFRVGYLQAVNRLDSLTPPAGLKLLLIPHGRLIVYRVQPGETVPDIAAAYGTTPDAIRRANRMETLTPPPGTVIFVPLA